MGKLIDVLHYFSHDGFFPTKETLAQRKAEFDEIIEVLYIFILLLFVLYDLISSSFSVLFQLQ